VIKKFLLLQILITSILVFVSYSFLSLNIEHYATGFESSVLDLKSVELRNGDMIFRRGISIESQIVLMSDRECEYSHVGMIYFLEGKPSVIHSVPADSGDDKEYIKLEPLEKFLAKDKASRFALYRLRSKVKDEPQKACEYAYDCYRKKYSFDNDYDLKSNSKLYCTELIWKAYKQAGIDLVENRIKSIDFLMINKKMIMPGSIIQSKLLENIYSN
jgi:hypothetical protein